MIKTHWVRHAVAFGAAVTLSLACYTVTGDVAASTFCQETDMAGISLSLGKYYVNNYVAKTTDSTSSDKTEVDTVAEKTSTKASAKTSIKKSTKTSTKKSSAKKTSANSTAKFGYDKLAISIANDYVNIRRHPSTRARITGRLYRGSAASIIRNVKGGWVQIESGGFKGYIKKEFLATGARAQKLKERYGVQYMKVKEGTVTLNVRTRTSTKSVILTQIPDDERYEVTKLCGNNWVRISIDGDRGYVAKEFVTVYTRYKQAVSMKSIRAKRRRRIAAKKAERERLAALAAEKAAASSSSPSSSSSGSKSGSSSGSSNGSSGSSSKPSSSKPSSSSYSSGSTGAQIAAYAQKFVGNPYVYGGSSLTNGTDCSGFTMSVYAQFGYSLPHSSAAQSGYGRSVSLSSVKPGDLIFYRNGGSIGHVAIYIGGGRVCHASNPSDGIKISNMNYRTPACARRIVG